MMRNRLYIEALRGELGPRKELGMASPNAGAEAAIGVLSRRRLLGIAGLAAAASAPLLRRLESLAGLVEVVTDRGRVAFRLNGVERWAIDKRRFAGLPRLDIARGPGGRVIVRLADALFPGTTLAADLACTLRPGLAHWWMDLAFPALGWSASLPFEPWLLSEIAAAGSGRGGGSGEIGRICDLGPQKALWLGAASKISFSPAWQLSFAGDGVAKVSGLGADLWSDDATLTLLPAGDPTLLAQPVARRTAILLRRGQRAWPLPIGPSRRAPWSLAASDRAFSRLTVEAGESQRGRQRHVLVASLDPADGASRPPTFSPGGSLRGADGEPAALALRDARYAIAFDPAGDQTTLVARLDPRPQWVQADGFGVSLTDRDDGVALEIAGENGVDRLSFEPAVAAASVPMPGALVATSDLPPGTGLPFRWSDLGCSLRRAGAHLHIGGDARARCVLPQPTTTVLRPRDMLSLRFELVHLDLQVSCGRVQLVRAKDPAGKPYDEAALIVHFPPQNIAEQAFYHQVPGASYPNDPLCWPARSRLAGPSRLAFRIPASVTTTAGIPFTLEALLDWRQLEPIVAPVALPPDTSLTGPLPAIAEPGPAVTSVEAPYRMILSPHVKTRWHNALAPTEKNQRVELWHTRLGLPNVNSEFLEDPAQRTVRAIWSPDYVPPAAGQPFGHYTPTLPPPPCGQLETSPCNLPFRTSLDRRDRHEIVRLTSDFGMRAAPGPGLWIPKAIPTRRLMLSSLGAWIDLEGVWDPLSIASFNTTCAATPVPSLCTGAGSDLEIESWRHVATQGRDHFVKVVYVGFLFPLGHRAVLVKETYRQFANVADHPGAAAQTSVAFLRQRSYIVVRERVKIYPAERQPNGGRRFPFVKIELDTTPSPDLDLYQNPDDFWPQSGGQDVLFKAKGTDAANGESTFALSLGFVGLTRAFITSPPYPFLNNSERYNGPLNGFGLPIPPDPCDEPWCERRTVPFHGQAISFAPSKKPGDTQLKTDEIVFGGELLDQATTDCDELKMLRVDGQVPFYPFVQCAAVHIPAIEHLAGTPTPTKIAYQTDYTNVGFGGAGAPATSPGGPLPAVNVGEVFAEILGAAPTSLKFPNDVATGGLAVPDLSVKSISRLAGPIGGDAAMFAKGIFDPTQFFLADTVAKINPLILGVVPLGELIQPIGELQNALDQIPRLILQQVNTLRSDVAQAEAKILGRLKTFSSQVNTAQQVAQGFVDRATASYCAAINQVSQTLQSTLNNLLPTVPPAPLDSLPACGGAQIAATDSPPMVPPPQVVIAAFESLRQNLNSTILQGVHQGEVIAQQAWDQLNDAFGIGVPLEIRKDTFVASLRTAMNQLRSPLALGMTRAVADFAAAVALLDQPQTDPVTIAFVQLPAALSAGRDLVAEIQAELQAFSPPAGQEADAVQRLLNQFARAKAGLHDAAKNFRQDLGTVLATAQGNARNAVTAIGLTSSNLEGQLAAQLGNALSAYAAQADPYLQLVDQLFADAAALQGALLTAKAQLDGAVASVKNAIQQQLAQWQSIEDEVLRELSEPTEIVVNYDISPPIASAPKENPVLVVQEGRSKFNLHVELRKSLVPSDPSSLGKAPTVTVKASLTDFSIVFLPFIPFVTVYFKSIDISFTTGSSPTIDPQVDHIEFGQALEFVKALEAILPFGGDDGLVVGLDAAGLTVGFSLAVPTITLGAFNLRALSLSAGVTLPFRDVPASVRFAISERDRPFILTYGIFGGGGFLAVNVDLHGVQRLEGSLEFGATAAIDVPGASGEAHILAGIYFSTSVQGAILTGFFSAGGSFDIVDLITLSIEFYMGLTQSGTTVEGDVIIHVSIDMGLFSIGVDLHSHRTLQGGGGGAAQTDLRAVPVARLAALDATAAGQLLLGAPGCAVPPADCPQSSLYQSAVWRGYRGAFAW